MTIIALLFSWGLTSASAQVNISPAQAKDYVGKKVTVCGTVASASFQEKGKKAPTFLNLDVAYPKQIFTVVIWGADRKKFGKPEADYLKKKVCATGTVETFKEKPQIVVSEPAQITVAQEKKEAPAATPSAAPKKAP
ncbi:MAG: DNA-binding protein [Elusimicrobia bacterium]|nr:DNA-binding protein [Elusimicrobiota bacterium]